MGGRIFQTQITKSRIVKPLIVLISVFVLSILAIEIGWRLLDLALSARIAMALMLLFTSIGHFKFTKGMAMMIPNAVPLKLTWVYLTGIFEILAAVGLLIPSISNLTAWFLIVFFMVMLPANINAAIKKVDFEKETCDGRGIKYLWFRVPLQIFFMVWIYLAAIR